MVPRLTWEPAMFPVISKETRHFVSDVCRYATLVDGTHLTRKQETFIAFCVGAMVCLGSINFAAFVVFSLGLYSQQALSWTLHHSKISWSSLLRGAIIKVLVDHGVSTLHLVIDDTDRPRSKVIKVLWGVFKTIDKVTGGWINAQNIVFLCIVTNKVTLPVMFSIYRPDPKLSAWVKKDKKLRTKGVKKRLRPPAPPRDKKYPSRIDIAMRLLLRFSVFSRQIAPKIGKNFRLKSILFDCAYLSPKIARFCRHMFPGVQTISQLASSQIVWDKGGHAKSVKEYFAKIKPVETEISLRGKGKKVSFTSARLFVKSHGDLLMIVAAKYEDEAEYRYIAATELSWRSPDVIRAYALRWLIEVVNFDWKQHDGWGRGACQQGADGACRGIILSLLVDCFLLTHPAQLHQSRAGLPLYTAGSVAKRYQYDVIIGAVEDMIASPDPRAELKKFSAAVDKLFEMRPSTKHMTHVIVEDFAPSPQLKTRWG